MSKFKEIEATNMSRAKRVLVLGVGINDASYKISCTVEGTLIKCPYYTTWLNMLKRCYDASYQLKNKTYIGCAVENSWLTFSNFKAWMEQQDWQDKQLDKDLLIKGNKLYSTETCLFVSKRLNTLINNQEAARGDYKLGVTFSNDRKKFAAHCKDGSKAINLGYFKTEDEAHLAYLRFKKAIVVEEALKQTDLKLKQALLTIANSYQI